MKFRSLTLMLCMALLLSTSFAFGAVKTFEREYSYDANKFDTLETSRVIALDAIKRILLEELGTYLISETVVSNYELTKDKVTTLSAGVVFTKIIKEKWDSKTYWLRAQIKADPDEVAQSINKLKNDSHKSKELAESRRKAKEANEEIVRLKAQLAKLESKKNSANKQSIIKETVLVNKKYNEAVDRLSAADWFVKGYALSDTKKYTEAINAYDKAIELDPKYVLAYNNRGVAYAILKQFDRAIRDYNKAIKLDPRYVDAYNNRGIAYTEFKQFDRAIRDYNKAIKLDPKYAVVYNNRGVTYKKLKQFDKAIRNFNKAIKLDPKYAMAYNNRGVAYNDLKQSGKAIRDYDKAIKFDPEYKKTYYNRCGAYAGLKQYNRAIRDCNKAIKLDPEYALPYYNKACIYSITGKPQNACSNLRTAVDKGFKYFSHIKKDGDLDNIRNASCYKKIMAGR